MQCRVIDCDKCTTLVWDVDSGLGRQCVSWDRGMLELSVPSAQFCYEPKTAVKNSLFLKKLI